MDTEDDRPVSGLTPGGSCRVPPAPRPEQDAARKAAVEAAATQIMTGRGSFNLTRTVNAAVQAAKPHLQAEVLRWAASEALERDRTSGRPMEVEQVESWLFRLAREVEEGGKVVDDSAGR